MPPRIAAVRVQHQWQAYTPRLRCVARLTRPLTMQEEERMGQFPDFLGSGDMVIYICRPENVEVWEKRLTEALEFVSAGSDADRLSRRHRRPGAPGPRLVTG